MPHYHNNNELPTVYLCEADADDALAQLPDRLFDLIYIDPPFNTGIAQTKISRKFQRSLDGTRIGFNNQRYFETVTGKISFADNYSDYLGFMVPKLQQAYRVLSDHGSLFVHLDYREVHYIKIILDQIFGRKNFINEIVWVYDFGARSRRRWSAKHDNILWFAKNRDDYIFNYSQLERIPYMAPSLVGAKKAKLGKTLTDSWWHTIVSPTGKEKTGYPTQKPQQLLRRLINVHTQPTSYVMDFFAGSGTLGHAAAENNLSALMIDNNPIAIQTMQQRFSGDKINYLLLDLADLPHHQFITVNT